MVRLRARRAARQFRLPPGSRGNVLGRERVGAMGQGVGGEVLTDRSVSGVLIFARTIPGIHIARTNMRKPGAPMIASNAGSRFSSEKTKPALA
jgi:hypothetical protein